MIFFDLRLDIMLFIGIARIVKSTTSSALFASNPKCNALLRDNSFVSSPYTFTPWLNNFKPKLVPIRPNPITLTVLISN